jgi:hypothetical protein
VSGVSFPLPLRSAFAARSRLLTLLILLANPRLLLEFDGRRPPWLSGVTSMGLDMAAGMIDIRPHGSFGVIRFASGVLTLLVGDAYLRLDTKFVLTLAGIVLLVALLGSCGEGLAY